MTRDELREVVSDMTPGEWEAQGATVVSDGRLVGAFTDPRDARSLVELRNAAPWLLSARRDDLYQRGYDDGLRAAADICRQFIAQARGKKRSADVVNGAVVTLRKLEARLSRGAPSMKP